MNQQIVILEDDKKLSKELEQYLVTNDYSCTVFKNGKDLTQELGSMKSDLFILDINVPGKNGLMVCSAIREAGFSCPILMLTAYGEIDDRVKAFELGADDYIVKPFAYEELLARIKALLRRGPLLNSNDSAKLVYQDIEMDTVSMQVTRAGKRIDLTPKEFKLLHVLLNANGKIVPRKAIIEGVWGINFETGTNAVEVYINFLRNKIDKGYSKRLIHNRSGFGYYIGESNEVES